MSYDPAYHESNLRRDEVDRLEGLVLLEFGANWCGICASFAPHVETTLNEHTEVRHIRVEDGRGKPLGRTFRVKLWPTFVFLREGHVVRQLSRPSRPEFEAAMAMLVQGRSQANGESLPG